MLRVSFRWISICSWAFWITLSQWFLCAFFTIRSLFVVIFMAFLYRYSLFITLQISAVKW
jgi:hypothetical protein